MSSFEKSTEQVPFPELSDGSESDLSLEQMEALVFDYDPTLLPEMVQVTSDQMERTLASGKLPAVSSSDMEVLRDAA